MENKIIAWITKDKDEKPCIFLNKPKKGQSSQYNTPHGEFATINEFYGDLFPFNNIQWEDGEPTKVKITIELGLNE